jgi:hypothetical protein
MILDEGVILGSPSYENTERRPGRSSGPASLEVTLRAQALGSLLPIAVPIGSASRSVAA